MVSDSAIRKFCKRVSSSSSQLSILLPNLYTLTFFLILYIHFFCGSNPFSFQILFCNEICTLSSLIFLTSPYQINCFILMSSNMVFFIFKISFILSLLIRFTPDITHHIFGLLFPLSLIFSFFLRNFSSFYSAQQYILCNIIIISVPRDLFTPPTRI